VRLFCDPRQGCARHYPAGFSIIILKAFDVKELTGSVEVMRATILLFFFFGLSTAGLTYCLTYLFKSASTAQNLVIFLNVICMFLIMASFIMGRVDSTCKADKSLQYIWMLLPSYSVGYGFVKVWHWGGSCWLSVFLGPRCCGSQLAFLDILPSLDASCDGGIKPGSAVRSVFCRFSHA
jgi:hypothetical protein